jgi:hypothetical protein
MSESEWRWPERVHRQDSRLRWACVIWTLHDEGPIVDKSGCAVAQLLDALRRRDSHPPVAWTIDALRQQITRMMKQAPLLLDRRGNISSTFHLGLGEFGGMPPNPYVDVDAAPTKPALFDSPAPRGRPKRGPEPKTEPEPSSNGHGEMTAADALAAVASFVGSAMVMAGVDHHEAGADEQLAEALAENRRLAELVEGQARQIMEQRRQYDVLKRALARRRKKGS